VLPALTAVKNRCFLPLSYDEVTPRPRKRRSRGSQRPLAAPQRLRPARRRFLTPLAGQRPVSRTSGPPAPRTITYQNHSGHRNHASSRTGEITPLIVVDPPKSRSEYGNAGQKEYRTWPLVRNRLSRRAYAEGAAAVMRKE
jgi:hypothetical protein